MPLTGISTRYFEQIDSTNDYMKEKWRSLDDLTVVRAGTQVRGRGRLQRNWISSAGGLWFSVFFKNPSEPPHHYQRLVGIALLEAVERALAKADNANRLFLKWPNDLVFLPESGNILKLAGILQENIYQPDLQGCIVGAGLNVNNELSAELREKASSLKQIAGREIPLEPLFVEVLNQIRARLYDPEEVVALWKVRSYLKQGYWIEVYSESDNRTVSGRVKDIPIERLDLINENGAIQLFFAGDVRILEIRR